METDPKNTAAIMAAAESAQKAAVSAAVVSVNIDHINANIRDIKDTLKQMSLQYVTREDFSEHLKEGVDHELRLRSLEKKQWRTAGATGVITGAISIFGIYALNIIQ